VITKTVAAQALIYGSIMRSPFKTQLHGNNDGPVGHDVGRASHERSSFPEKNTPDFSAMFKPSKGKEKYEKSYGDPYRRYPGHGYAGSVDDWNFAPDEFYKLSSTEPAGFRALLLSECVAYLENRTREFEGFDLHANDLQEEVSTSC
jgi:hypothetical protein